MNTKTETEKEKLRLAALREFQILDTLPEQEFDDLTLLASQICATPIAAISLLDENRQWFKSQIGLNVAETPRECAFCEYAVGGDGIFTVPDAAADQRFSANPLVTGAPHIRFYAGALLTTFDGQTLGTLCVIDRQPRSLSEAQKRALNALARSVMNLIEARSHKETEHFAQKENPAAKLAGKSERDEAFFGGRFKHYLIATLIVAFISLIKVGFQSVTQLESPFLLFAFGVLLSSWRGGLGPGIYATLITILVINYFFIAPSGAMSEHSFGYNLTLLIFGGQGVLIAGLCASRLRGEQLLSAARNGLEQRVAHRTTQLAEANQELKQEIRERTILQEDLRQARDAALESVRLKSEFLANMSHEIRTPMNGVIGMTGLLLETDLNAEQRRFAKTIRTSGESLLTIINDILDFSKIEAGKTELEELDFNLRDLIESLIELFSTRAEEQKNELAALIYADVPLLVRGDAGRIRQILTNLIGNAIKFTQRGDIVVRVKKIRETNQRIELKFSVTDTGEGISEEVQSRLFQPFTQSDASTTRRFGGTGLGLSISRKLVEMMDGEIGLKSVPGEGSTFWFSLALEKQESEAFAVAADDQLKGRRVLIVDDNPVNREILTYQTQFWKMNVREAASGAEALKVLSTETFDLIILDYQMPDLNGLEVAHWIGVAEKSATRPAAPPIIMLSSSGAKFEADRALALGIRSFLHKPYRQNDLLNAICQALNLSPAVGAADSDIHITAAPESDSFVPVHEKSKRILIVEDNSVNQMVAQAQLEKFGYRADLAANGLEALKALELIDYDLILMDCQMPEMDGYEASREIRARDWRAARIPIIAMTANVAAGEREKCLHSGMDDFISKPVCKNTLRQRLAQWLAASDERANFPVSENGAMNSAEKEFSRDDSGENEAFFAEDEKNDAFRAVDLATLDEVTDDNPEMRRQIIEIYLRQTATQLDELEQAAAASNAAQIYELAHKTVGGSMLCGMTAIVEPMRALEKMGRDGSVDDGAALVVAQARAAFAEIESECRRILES